MADNLTTNPGAGGAVIATDEIAGVHYPISKLAFGDPDNATMASESSPLPTVDANTAAVLQAINQLNDTMLYMLSAMLDKMPRVDRTDALSVSFSDTGLSNQYVSQIVNGVSNRFSGFTADRMFEPWNFSDAGSARLYQQIQVS